MAQTDGETAPAASRPCPRVRRNARGRGAGRGFMQIKIVVIGVCLAAGIGAGDPATAEPAHAAAGGAATGQVGGQIQALFDEGEALFQSAAQPECIGIFSQVINTLETQTATMPLSGDERSLLLRSLLLRAEAQFNLGETGAATDDLRRVISVDPATQLDASRISPRFLDLFDSLRAEMVGHLALLVMPRDAEVRIDGTEVDSTQLRYALETGRHVIVARRAGYADSRGEVVIDAGSEAQLDLVLERTSAVIRVVTRPSGAALFVDGVAMGATSGVAPFTVLLGGAAALLPREDFSDELVVDGLQPGLHRIEVTLDGYRTARHEVSVSDLDDYRDVVVLEQPEGLVLLEDLPEDAVVSVNDVVTIPEPPSSDASASVPFLRLPVGEHRIVVDEGTRGRFEATLDVADLESIAVQVRVRPTVTLLGVLGGDGLGERAVRAALDDAFSTLDDWMLLARTDWNPEILQQLGATVELLRALGGSQRPATTALDWNALQAAVDEQRPSSVYVLGVLSDDLVATHADLWMWPAAPGPSLGDPLRVALDGGTATATISNAFVAELVMERPWLGALLIDSDAAPGPVVMAVTDGSPAAVAGIQTGDVLLAIDGSETLTVVQATAQLSVGAARSAVSLSMSRDGAPQAIELTVGASPSVFSLNDAGMLYPVLFAKLAALGDSNTRTDTDWIVRLNQAAAFLQAGAPERAVQELRFIEAPAGAGFGQAAVDYWLGVALSTLGPSYVDAARQAFTRAASESNARLFHNDGPWVALRARARLGQLSDTP